MHFMQNERVHIVGGRKMNRQIAGMLLSFCVLNGCGSDSQPTSQKEVKTNQTTTTAQQNPVNTPESTTENNTQSEVTAQVSSNQPSISEESRNEAEKLFSQGMKLLKQGKLPDSTKAFSAAINLNPQDSRYYFHRGSVWADLKQDANAIVDLTNAIEMNPKNAQYFYTRALFFMTRGGAQTGSSRLLTSHRTQSPGPSGIQ